MLEAKLLDSIAGSLSSNCLEAPCRLHEVIKAKKLVVIDCSVPEKVAML